MPRTTKIAILLIGLGLMMSACSNDDQAGQMGTSDPEHWTGVPMDEVGDQPINTGDIPLPEDWSAPWPLVVDEYTEDGSSFETFQIDNEIEMEWWLQGCHILPPEGGIPTVEFNDLCLSSTVDYDGDALADEIIGMEDATSTTTTTVIYEEKIHWGAVGLGALGGAVLVLIIWALFATSHRREDDLNQDPQAALAEPPSMLGEHRGPLGR